MTMKFSRNLAGAAIALLPGLILMPSISRAADPSTLQSLITAAKAEGMVIWYTTLPQPPGDALVAAFKQKYGITVNSVRISPDLLLQRFPAERDSGNIVDDVLTMSDMPTWEEYRTKGWFDRLDVETIPALSDFPAKYIYGGTYALVSISPVGVAFNTDFVNKADISKWSDLLNPKFKGKIALSDPASTLSYIDQLRRVEESDPDYVKNLAKQDLKVMNGAVPTTQQCTAGEAWICFPTLMSVVGPLRDNGAPVDLVFLPPTVGNELLTGIVSKSKHPNAAKLFFNYMISQEGQAVLNKKISVSPLTDLPGALPLPPNYVSPDFASALKARPKLIKDLGR